jgi:hypothetical protein
LALVVGCGKLVAAHEQSAVGVKASKPLVLCAPLCDEYVAKEVLNSQLVHSLLADVVAAQQRLREQRFAGELKRLHAAYVMLHSRRVHGEVLRRAAAERAQMDSELAAPNAAPPLRRQLAALLDALTAAVEDSVQLRTNQVVLADVENRLHRVQSERYACAHASWACC